MSDTPLVSIIIPTKDRAPLLRRTLASVAAQTYANWECRVIDDCSSDDTVTAVGQISRVHPRVTLEVRSSSEGGANVCRNLGLRRALGKYLLFLDSDDLLAPHCLRHRVKAMEADASLDFAVFGMEVFRDVPGDLGLLWNGPSDLDDLSRFLELDTVWQTMAPLWRRDSFKKLREWDESLLSFQDWELHVRAIAMGLKYEKSSEVDCFCRHPEGREAISTEVSSPEHLRSHVHLLEKVRRVLDENAAMTEPRQRRLIGLYLWLADKFRRRRLNSESAMVWNDCRAANLISGFEWAEGRLFLTGQGIPLLRRATRMYLLSRWPEEMIRKGSKTLINVPVRPDAVTREPRKMVAGFYEFPA